MTTIAVPADLRTGVVVPVYNRATTLMPTLASVVEQELPPEKLVVVDDGSTDGTADAAESWLRAANPRFSWQVVRSSHRNAAAARNVGLIEIGELPLVAFLDSDDSWPTDFLRRTTRQLEADPDAVAVSADRAYFNAKLKRHQTESIQSLPADPIHWMFFNGAGIASCSLFRTDAVLSADAWPEELEAAEDFKLFVGIAQLGPWLHAAGRPVLFDHGSAAARGEEGNLSSRHADSNRRWVHVYEEVFEDLRRSSPHLNHRPLAEAIALVWGRAGKQLFQLGRTAEARQCFVRALRWKPTMLKSWRRLAVAAVVRQKAA